MPARRWFVALTLASCACSPRAATPAEPAPLAVEVETSQVARVHGRVLAHDGAPLTEGRAKIHRSHYREAVAELELPSDGRFEVELPGAGAYMLEFTGVDHAQLRRFVLVDDGAQVEVEARLGTYAWTPKAGEPVSVRLRFVDAAGEASDSHAELAAPVEGRTSRYALQLEVPADARAVQLQVDTGVGRTFNVPVIDPDPRFVYDGGGDYWTERAVAGGETVELEIDLGARPEPGLRAAVEIGGDVVAVSRQHEARALLNPYQGRVREAMQASESADEACAKLGELADEAAADVRALDDRELGDVAALEWAWMFGQFGRQGCMEADDLRWVLARVEPDDPNWVFLGPVLDHVFGVYADDAEIVAYRDRLAAAQIDPGLRAQLLYNEIVAADARGAADVVRERYAELASTYAGSVPAFWARSSYDPDRPLQVGETMPAWTFSTLEGEPFASTQLDGRTYLLEVWATWCGPCVRQMEGLHAAHEALGGAEGPIAFVSLSMDGDVEAVDGFREQWPMPWINLHVPTQDHAALYDAWQFSGIPTAVLVDGEGTIRATTAALRDDQLLATLRALVGESS